MEEVAASSQRKIKRTKQALEAGNPELERIDSLPRNSAIPQQNEDDPFSIFIGSNELEGGLLL